MRELVERLARGEKNGSEIAASVCGKCRVAVLVRQLKGTIRRIDALPRWSPPRDQERKDLCSKARQVAAFDQITSGLSESVTRVVVAEAGTADEPDRRIVRSCCVAVAALQAEIDHSAGRKRPQVFVSV